MSVSKSPHQVISDGIDATSHQILQLCDNGESLCDLALDLDTYIELLDRAHENDETDCANQEPVLKEAHIRNRLLMAKMVVALCLRSAYPDTENTFTPLIQLSETQWRDLGAELEYLWDIMQNEDKFSRQMDELQDSYFSLRRRMESMEALARLKSQLTSFVDDLGDDDAPEECIAEYKRTAEANGELLEGIHGATGHYFYVPTKDLPRVINADSLTSLITKIDDMLTKKVIPLSEMQSDFSKLAKHCNACLPPPKFFEVGYFRESNSFTEEINSQPNRVEDTDKPPSTPIAPAGTSISLRKSSANADNDESQINVKKPRAKRKRARTGNKRDDEVVSSQDVRRPCKEESPKPKKSGENELDFDSDTETKTSVSSNSKRKKRVPYTDEEKTALIEGVKQYGVGSWKEILQHYDDVFKQNKRSNVNLKDLYRTLTKRD